MNLKQTLLTGADYSAGQDAVFLPGKIHGCEHQVYIIYYNEDANNGDGCWEIGIIDAYRILNLYQRVGGNADNFFALLPDLFHGEWRYCDRNNPAFAEYEHAFLQADFIHGVHGDINAEMLFLVDWAKQYLRGVA